MGSFLSILLFAAITLAILFIPFALVNPEIIKSCFEKGDPETPGYAFSSFNYVSRKLPKPPAGCAWENKVITKSDEVWHELSLLRLKDEKVLGSRRVSLTNHRSNGDGFVYWSWARNRQDFGIIHADACYKNSNILVNWASQKAHTPANDTVSNYELKG